VDLDLVFLGTAGSSPTPRRSPPALLIRRGGDRLLIDCAEGTQRQLMRSTIGLPDLPDIFLTHFHADHYLGLPGMLKTFALRGREVPITIHGPRGLRELFVALRRIFGKLTYPYELVELQAGDVVARGDYRIATFAVAHGVPSLGYALVEETRPGRFDVGRADALGVGAGPERGRLQAGETIALADGTVVRPEQVLGPARAGRTICITGDTAPSLAFLDVVESADLLVHEATFCDDERERARETQHSTAREAAQVAAAAGVRMLALTHLSSRYFGPEVAKEARDVFPETVVPRDFDVIDIPFPERGAPQLVKGGALESERRPDAVQSAPE
jgi:ribonuclease Z